MTWPYQTFSQQQTRRRVFVSFHHKDQWWRDRWDALFGDMLINVSVGEGEIDDSNSAEYIKRLIQQDYLRNASVAVVLVGAETYCRKHVDWEISGAVTDRVGGRSGLIGIWLPTRLDGSYGIDRASTPARLLDNLDSGYARWTRWTEDRAVIQRYVEDAFQARVSRAHLARNSRPQMQRNTCG